MIQQSRDHLAGADEGYFEHLTFAATVGLMTVAAGLACLIHAFIPALCQCTASRTIGLLSQLFEDRGRLEEVRDRSIEAIAFAFMILFAAGTTLLIAGSGAPALIVASFAALCFGVPVAHLLGNRELDRVAA